MPGGGSISSLERVGRPTMRLARSSCKIRKAPAAALSLKLHCPDIADTTSRTRPGARLSDGTDGAPCMIALQAQECRSQAQAQESGSRAAPGTYRRRQTASVANRRQPAATVDMSFQLGHSAIPRMRPRRAFRPVSEPLFRHYRLCLRIDRDRGLASRCNVTPSIRRCASAL